MLNLQICTVIIMTKKKNIKKKSRFEPGIDGFEVHQDIHYAMEANAIYQLKITNMW